MTLKHSGTHDFHVRWVIRRDLDQVITVETTAAKHDNWEFPSLTADDVTALMRKRHYIGYVCTISTDDDEVVVGHGIKRIKNNGVVVLERLVVAPQYRRFGVARALVQRMVKWEQYGQIKKCAAYVPETALSAQLFLRSEGFKAVRITRDTPPVYLMLKKRTQLITNQNDKKAYNE